MEDLSRTPQPTPQKSKTKLKVALLIVWLIICTAMLIYCLTLNITYINSYIKQIAEWRDPDNLSLHNAEEVIKILNKGITRFSFSLTFEILLYSSFVALLIPKLAGEIRLLRIERREDIPPQ